MRIALAGFGHETNSFSPMPTNYAAFCDGPPQEPLREGEALLAPYRGTGTIFGGFLAAAPELGIEPVGLLRAFAGPAGLVEQDAFDQIAALLLERLAAAGSVDGLFLDLHGAMVTSAHDDAEAELLRRIRAVVGDDLPIVGTFDLHGNITREMVDLADLLIGYDLYPHTDEAERGAEAAELLARLVRCEIQPTAGYRSLPLLTPPPGQFTSQPPMSDILDQLHAIEAREGILVGSVAPCFPYSDIQQVGAAVLVYADDAPEAADAAAAELADALWQRREDFAIELTTTAAAYELACRSTGGPVILADGSDNPGGGGPCDGTTILHELIAMGASEAVVAVICDPETARQAHDAGIGNCFEARIGGKTDRLHGPPVACQPEVVALTDGRFIYRGPMSRGRVGQMGLTAVLRIGGVSVIVVTSRLQVWEPEILRSCGLEPADQRLLALKSAVHYRAAFEPLASACLNADTPGCHRPELTAIPYQRVRRPIYPLDPDMEYDPRGDGAES